MIIHWPTVLAAGLASFVEFVEALTIVLAVGVVRGWRTALLGAAAATLTLALLILLLGSQIGRLNVPLFKIIMGTLILMFGLRWLRKAALRSAGVIALHDEAAAFAKESEALRKGATGERFDFGGAAAAFNGVFIEGVEVVFIVLAVGGVGGRLVQASLGAVIAAVAVILLGLVARQPLTRIPENTLKLVVGVLVSAFGTFWVGEGLSLHWPGEDFALIVLSLGYLSVAAIGVALARAAKTQGQSVTKTREPVAP